MSERHLERDGEADDDTDVDVETLNRGNGCILTYNVPWLEFERGFCQL